jgi:hypothetical protein
MPRGIHETKLSSHLMPRGDCEIVLLPFRALRHLWVCPWGPQDRIGDQRGCIRATKNLFSRTASWPWSQLQRNPIGRLKLCSIVILCSVSTECTKLLLRNICPTIYIISELEAQSRSSGSVAQRADSVARAKMLRICSNFTGSLSRGKEDDSWSFTKSKSKLCA